MRITALFLTGAAVLAAGGAVRPAIAAEVVEPAPGYHVARTIPVPGDGGWDYLTASGGRLFISRGDRIQVIDLSTGKVAGEVTNTPGVHGVAIARRAGHGFTSNGGDSSVTVFDLQTLKPVAHVSVGQRPDAIFYDPESNRVFTCNAGSQDATAIDVTTNKVAGTVPLGGRPEFGGADGRDHVYINIEDKSEVVDIDSQALKLLHR